MKIDEKGSGRIEEERLGNLGLTREDAAINISIAFRPYISINLHTLGKPPRPFSGVSLNLRGEIPHTAGKRGET